MHSITLYKPYMHLLSKQYSKYKIYCILSTADKEDAHSLLKLLEMYLES